MRRNSAVRELSMALPASNLSTTAGAMQGSNIHATPVLQFINFISLLKRLKRVLNASELYGECLR